MQKLKIKNKIFFLTAVFLAFFIFTPFVLVVAADSPTGVDDALTGLTNSASQGYMGELGKNDEDMKKAGVMTSFTSAIGKVVGVILSLVGVAFLVLMIYGGFTWMLARGNEQEVTKAIDLIQSAVIGLIVVLAAYAITAYIGNKLM